MEDTVVLDDLTAEKPKKSFFKRKKSNRPDFDKVTWKQDFKRNWPLWLIALIPIVFFVVFHYAPMIGLLMAFEDFSPSLGFFKSEWVGFDNFKMLFTGSDFPNALRNTFAIAALNLTLGFIAPVVLGVLVSQLRSKRFSRVVQTVSYMPFFVSSVVICSIATMFLDNGGAITKFFELFGYKGGNMLAQNSPMFWFIICFIGIWNMAGYSSIIYITSISGINKDLYDAAAIDGANRWHMLKNITIPSILPMIIMLFTMQIGQVFKVGFDKVLLLYLPKTLDYSDVLYTYTYRLAFGEIPDFGLSTAATLFQSLMGMALLLIGNWLSKKFAKTSMF